MPLVQTYDQVRENAKEFSRVGEREDSIAYQRFANFQHWYYFSDIDEGVFAPSKFIGYQDTTLDNYIGTGNGGATEQKLNLWFSKCDHESTEFTALEKRLNNFAETINRRVNARVGNGDGGVHLPTQAMDFSGRLFPDEVDENALVEGARKTVMVNAHERNPEARRQCLAEHGYKCRVCKVLFEEIYGDLGKEFIHVHHLLPVASVGREYTVDPIHHLCPVCPNCHAMMHREEPPLTPDELVERMKEKRSRR